MQDIYVLQVLDYQKSVKNEQMFVLENHCSQIENIFSIAFLMLYCSFYMGNVKSFYYCYLYRYFQFASRG